MPAFLDPLSERPLALDIVRPECAGISPVRLRQRLYARAPSCRRWSLSRCLFVALAPFIVHCAQAQMIAGDVSLAAIGGSGGGQFVARCAQGELLAGFDLRTGDDVDAIKPVCLPAPGGEFHPYPAYFGGGGGGPRQLVCPYNVPVVTGMYIESQGQATEIVHSIHLFCGTASANQTASQFPAVAFDGPVTKAGGLGQGFGMQRSATQRCPSALLAVGINGRYGVWLDAVGLICGAPPVPAQRQAPPQPANIVPGNVGKPPVALGRVKSADPSGTTADMPNDPPICATAHSARARNSPAAPGLERQCAAARVKAATAATATSKTYSSPAFDDGALLWACADAAEAEPNDGACLGLKAGEAFCRMQGFSDLQAGADGALGVAVKTAQSGKKVRAINGDTCTSNCLVIGELNCAP